MWCWRGIENVNLTDCVRNEEVISRIKERKNVLHTIKRRKANGLVTHFVGTALLSTLLKER
jgi:hypothetical protein